MPKSLTKDEAYAKCKVDGMFLPQKDVDKGTVSTMLAIVDEDLKTVEDLRRAAERPNTLYKLSYDALHTLTEALLLVDKIRSKNHQCLFAYLCLKHPELDLEWDFFEKIRTRRNGIHYFGTSVSRHDWKEIEVQALLYIKTLRDEIVKMLNSIN